MSAYRPYPKYKDSGVEWVGQIPAHWSEAPTFAKVCESKTKNGLGLEDNVLSLSYGNIVRRNVDDNFGLLPESFNTYQIVKSGDVILRLTDLQNDKRSLRVGLTKESGIITSAYLNLRAKSEVDSSYLYRLLHSYDTTKVFYGMGGGLRQSMKFEDFRRLPLILPPLPEQIQIAAFLDRECGKLDALQAKQGRLIELLKEKRQALISHAVTKGLDPSAKLKPSGIEWLGEAPEGWDILKASQLFRAAKGKYGQMLTKEFCSGNSGEYPVYSGQTENEGLMGTWSEFEFDFGNEGVLFSTTVGSGKVMSLRQIFGKFSLSQNCMVIWPTSKRCATRFYYYHFQPLFDYEKNLIPQHMQASFRMEDFYGYKIALPPLAEQLAIVAHLDEKCGKIDQLKAKAERGIELLKERRSALISAAVTGKIDVREAATAAASPP
jgi:type I restriction enzyme S subunit